MTSFTKSSCSVPFARADAAGVVVRLKVAPRASRERIEGTVADSDGGAALKVSVTAAPEGGRANAAVIALVARVLRLPKSSLAVVSGASSRRKTLRIAGDHAEIEARLAALAEE